MQGQPWEQGCTQQEQGNRLAAPSGTSLALHPARSPCEQHAVMGDADDFDHAVAPRAIHDDVPWPVDPLALLHPVAPKPQRIRPHAGDFPDLV